MFGRDKIGETMLVRDVEFENFTCVTQNYKKINTVDCDENTKTLTTGTCRLSDSHFTM